MWPQRPSTNGKHNERGRSGLSSIGYEKVKTWLPAARAIPKWNKHLDAQ